MLSLLVGELELVSWSHWAPANRTVACYYMILRLPPHYPSLRYALLLWRTDDERRWKTNTSACVPAKDLEHTSRQLITCTIASLSQLHQIVQPCHNSPHTTLANRIGRASFAAIEATASWYPLKLQPQASHTPKNLMCHSKNSTSGESTRSSITCTRSP